MRFFKKIFIPFLIFFLFFSTHFYKLSQTPIYPDEITWIVRAKETALAIRTGNINFFQDAWWNIKDDTEAIALPLTVLTGFPLIYFANDASVLSFNLFPDYLVARTSAIFLSSIFIVFYYFVAKKIANQKVAIISSLLLILDPLFNANSKLVMNDIFLTMFCFMTVSVYFLIKNKKISVFLTAIFLSLAFLTKPNSLVVLPVLFCSAFLNPKTWKQEIKHFVLVMILSLVLVSALWPKVWFEGLGAFVNYFSVQKEFTNNGINNFFLGKVTFDPGILYYPFQILSRFPVIVLLAFLFSLKKIKKSYLFGLIFIVTFVGLMSFFPKKLGARYILPIWPWVYIFAGTGLICLIDKIKKIHLRVSAYLSIIFVSLFIFIQYFPNHYLFYNKLVGGSKNAVKYDLVAICSGSKDAVDYILECFEGVDSVTAVGCGSSTIPYYYPFPSRGDWKNSDIFFVENYYLQLDKDLELNEFYNSTTPTHTVMVNEVGIAHIYTKNNLKDNCK